MPEFNVKLSLSETTVVVSADDAEEAAELALEGQPDGTLITVAMTEASVEALYAEVLGRLNKTYTLFYVSQGDQLSDDQVAMLVKGDILGVEEQMDDWLSDNRYEAAMYAIKEVTTEGERVALADMLDDLRFAIEERDDSYPLRELARYTPAAYVRYDLGDLTWPFGQSEEEDIYPTLLETLGITPTGKQANAGDGMNRVYLFWRADVEDILRVQEGVQFRDEKFTLTVKDPEVLVHDTWNGSGYSETITGWSWTGDFDPEKLILDKKDGYGYEETCGGFVGGSFESEVTFTKKEG